MLGDTLQSTPKSTPYLCDSCGSVKIQLGAKTKPGVNLGVSWGVSLTLFIYFLEVKPYIN